MSENEIKPGDVVELKSGGPEMTVAFADGRQLYCRWFAGADVKGERFYAQELKLAKVRD